MDEAILRAKARTAIEGGRLPARRPDRTWGGPGIGVECAVCELPVTAGELEFEVQFARPSGERGLDRYHVHVRCFAAWELERGAA